VADQLNLLGLAAEEAPVIGAARLVPTQRQIVALARRPEGVTASEAGRIIHAFRHGGHGCNGAVHGYARVRPAHSDACCPFMAIDGSRALKRLRDQGLLGAPDQKRGPWHVRKSA
jgi:hypothetical protein